MSNKTCTQGYCRIKLISRYQSYLNFGCFFSKPLQNIMLSFNVSHRSPLGGNFHYVYGFKNLNACDLTKFCANNPMMKPLIDYTNKTIFSGMIRECPYSGFVRIENASIYQEDSARLIKFQIFPNGEYKVDIKLFNKRDENMATLSIIIMTTRRQNTLAGNDKF